MPRIVQLPHSVITKIAAGEVIERPASVVKELLENSIDAGSSRIELDLEQGGTELIRVVDDGGGIEPDDLVLAFASHATSKLRSAEDLFQIGSMGFRGEALASIGGIARVTLQSRAAGWAEGAELACNGGELSDVRPWNGSPGTRIEVRHLFFNTPVRKKFLKTNATELNHICETVHRLALANPTRHFVLRHNARPVLEVAASAGLKERIGQFFGDEIRDKLYELKVEQGPATLTGFIGDPSCERGNAKLQYLFVNGRWVRDRSLGHALQEAYRGLLMTGRYAVGFLFIGVPPDSVDVNVHPTKAEVRFRDSQAVYHLVRSGVKNRLGAQNLVPRLRVPAQFEEETAESTPSMFDSPRWTTAAQTAAPWEAPKRIAHVGPNSGVVQESGESGLESEVENPGLQGDSESGPLDPHFQSPGPRLSTAPAPGPQTAPAPVRRAIQIHDSYLVVETPDGMLVIDQHALHERILFEQLRRRIQAGQLEVQRMLIPEPVDFSADQAACVLEARDELHALGLDVDDFGGGTILLASYPALLGRAAPVEVLKSVVDCLVTRERAPSKEQLLHDLLATMACKAAVKAGDRLTHEEISHLMELRDLADDSHHCPHGRPTSLVFTKHELEKQFRRI